MFSIGKKRWPAALRALRHRNFLLFFSGQLISLTGTWMQTVAQSWLVYRLTGSAVALGVVGFSSQIPVFLLAPLGGLTADRGNRRAIVIMTQAASMILAFVLSVLTLTHAVTVHQVIFLAAALGVVNAFDIPARQAFIVEMVSREDLVNAIGLNSSMFNGARIVGPAAAGALVAAVGEGWCFFANAVSYVAVIIGLFLMKTRRRERIDTGASALAEIAEGFGFTLKAAPIGALLLLLGLVSVMGMPYSVLMPIFADRIFHGGAQVLGYLMGATGVGALAGALALAARRHIWGLGLWVAVSAGGFGAALVAFSMARSLWLSLLLLFPVGCFMMVAMASSNTLIQSMVPDRFRGRVMAVYSMVFMGMAPLGSLLAGALSEKIGAPETVALGGVMCLAGAGVYAYKRPSFREEGRRMILAQQVTAGAPPQQAGTGPLSPGA